MKHNLKEEMESKAKRGELIKEGISKHAIFNTNGTLFLDFL